MTKPQYEIVKRIPTHLGLISIARKYYLNSNGSTCTAGYFGIYYDEVANTHTTGLLGTPAAAEFWSIEELSDIIPTNHEASLWEAVIHGIPVYPPLEVIS